MPNNRSKGKRIERYFATALRPIFPDVRRNAGEQAQSGGRDLENTGILSIEVKGGKQYKSKMIRMVLDQAQQEAGKGMWAVALIKPDREDAYAMMPFDDFLEMLEAMKKEGIL